MATKSRSPSKI